MQFIIKKLSPTTKNPRLAQFLPRVKGKTCPIPRRTWADWERKLWKTPRFNRLF